MKTPSIKTLSLITDKAKQAKELLLMSRAELEQTPVGFARLTECYHPPKTWDIRMTCLNSLLDGFGVDSFQLKNGSWVEYINLGDTYSPTIVRINGNYRVTSWGDIAEKYA
jgi:hypothetical protein